MVYGRYNELVNGVYKPTNITGGHHIVVISNMFSFPQDVTPGCHSCHDGFTVCEALSSECFIHRGGRP